MKSLLTTFFLTISLVTSAQVVNFEVSYSRIPEVQNISEDIEALIRYYREKEQRDKEMDATMFYLGDLYYRTGDLSTAISYYRKVTPDFPAYKETVKRLAYISFHYQHDEKRADEYLTLLNENDPEDTFPLFYRAEMASARGDEAERQRLMTTLSRRDRQTLDASSTYGLGVYFFEEQQYADVIPCLSLAIKTGVANAEFYYMLGESYHRLGLDSAALKVFIEALEKHPDQEWLFTHVGVSQWNLGETTKAEQHFNQVIARYDGEPVDQLSYREIRAVGKAHLRLRAYTSAIEYFRYLYTHYRPTDTEDNLAALMFLLNMQHDYEETLNLYAQKDGDMQVHEAVWLRTADAYVQTGDQEKALTLIQQVLRRYPASEIALRERNEVLMELDRSAEAKALAHNLIRGDSTYHLGYSLLAAIYFVQQENDSTIYYTEKAIEYQPEPDDKDMLRLKKAVAHYHSEQVHKAKEELGQIQDKEIMKSMLFATLTARVMMDLKAYEKSEMMLRESIDYFDDDDELWHYMGLLYYRQKRWEEAIIYLDNHLDTYAETDAKFKLKWASTLLKAICLMRLGDMKESKKLYKRCLIIFPENHVALLHYGIWYKEKGNLNKACRYFGRAHNLGNKNAHTLLESYCLGGR